MCDESYANEDYFCLLKTLDLFSPQVKCMNKSKNAHTLTTLGAPLNRNQSRKFIFALSSLHFTVCYPALS